ncbi:MAG: pyridoxamine 5'-phosphate oxidase family protein [Chloroflexi bacterium]|nr:pyridoxamine 5'-phosphate oxidase family protein [Chloroflexota bacterium]MBV9602579.1 pyridoxamine 5'-phosphate oxidase family protein [Chloroflexota bacterium]
MRTERVRVRRLPKRAAYDRATIHAILDEALVCHLGFVHADQPFVIPTLHARIGDRVYVHGSSASRMLGKLTQGVSACITVTLIDGLVLARSAFHHSINYRSVVLLGIACAVTDPEEKLAALHAFTDHLVPGRWDDVRSPTPQELKATSVLYLPLQEASAKVRVGPPVDDEEDYAMDVWAGVLPLRLQAQRPEADPRLDAGIAPPGYLTAYHRGAAHART